MSATTTIEMVMGFTLTNEDGTSWRHFAIFRRADVETLAGVVAPAIPRKFDPAWGMSFPDWDAMSDEDRAKVHAVADAAVNASPFYYFDRGAGRAFGSEPSATIHKRFVVVRQTGGLDI